MAYIYKITNKLNGKVYIGKTEKSVEKRWQEHKNDYKSPRCEKRPLYAAMNKYGTDNFSVELLEETDSPEEREIYWIEQYDSFGNGYNATKGGDGKSYVDKEKIFQLWKEGLSVREIVESMGICQDTVSLHLKNQGITKTEKKKRSAKYQKKRVAQIDMFTGETIQVFNSSEDAGESIGKTGGHIRQVCIGDRKSAYGYVWKHV